MNTRIISDTHFNHDTLIHKFGRPADFEKRLQMGLKKIKKDDLLIHLGDVCINKDKEMHEKYIKPLLCKKLLVRGNHDNKTKTWYMNHGRDRVVDEYIIDNGKGQRILFSHQPLIPLWDGVICIHGHYHDRLIKPISDRHILYSPEKENYKPKNLKDFYLTS